MHCCFNYIILSLAENPQEILNLQSGSFGITIKDIDNDGTYEIESNDPIWSYWHSCFGCASTPPLVIAWENNQYLLRTSKYKYLWNSQMIENEKCLNSDCELNINYFLDEPHDLVPAFLVDILLMRIYTGDWRIADQAIAEFPLSVNKKKPFCEDVVNTLQHSQYWPKLVEMDTTLENLQKEFCSW